QAAHSRILIDVARRSGRPTSACWRPLSAVGNANFCGTPTLRRKDFSQKWRGSAHPVFSDLLRCPRSNDLPAGIARFWTDIDNVIRFRDYAEVVLNHDDSMTVIHQPVPQVQQ